MFFGSQPSGFPKTLKYLIFITSGIFIVDVLTKGSFFQQYFALNTYQVTEQFQLWRMSTYMFLHHIGGPFHILLNMLMLWMFGLTIIAEIGERRFLTLYLSSGLFAGMITVLFNFFLAQVASVTGASGAVFSILVLFALHYPNREIMPWGLFTVKAKWLILFLIGIDLLFLNSDNIARITHLGGALYGYLYFKFNHLFTGIGGQLALKKKSWFEKKSEKSNDDVQMSMEEIDPVLKKISEQGIESLTKSEKKILDKASDMKKKQKSKIIKLDDYRRQR